MPMRIITPAQVQELMCPWGFESAFELAPARLIDNGDR